ncbi:hypothetical protein FLK61_25725 [Paenalkalicoccus suaedae]|uniref:DUF4367 domain-containing protein n=1 Tax=Paenalkalicoccus suaedae TaxID=2592382 RepID=A0A859FBL3_9BACI|nr:hypothetical protein [Paenalkalicoccus suaedae]QKS70172.1 hypothetical protein FLK61_25725 [Paenalkalicoccus suaedae]
MKIWHVFTIVLVLLVGCSQNEETAEVEFPYSYIHETFSYDQFYYPDSWEVVAISSSVPLIYRDGNDPDAFEYSNTPTNYRLTFGEEAPENEVVEEALEEFNVQQARGGSGLRQLYYHSYFAHYADLTISQNGFHTLLMEYDAAMEWEVENRTVIVLQEGNEWAANWTSGGVYYDLIVRGEALIESEEQFRGLLEQIIGA